MIQLVRGGAWEFYDSELLGDVVTDPGTTLGELYSEAVNHLFNLETM